MTNSRIQFLLAGALLLGQLRGIDIRSEGSGNAGATNALRTRGAGFAAGVLLIDVAKGLIGARLLPILGWPSADPSVSRDWLAAICAAASPPCAPAAAWRRRSSSSACSGAKELKQPPPPP